MAAAHVSLARLGLTFKLTRVTLAGMTSSATRPAFPSLAELPGRPCPIAASLEVVGERWSLLVVRELWMGSHHFGEIVQGTGAPRDRIAARLKLLESAGVVARIQYQEAPQRFEYHLTESGKALVPVLKALLEWGREYAVPDDPDLHLSTAKHTQRAQAARPGKKETR